MEDVLDMYRLPYNPDIPVVCVDESCKQLLEDVRTKLSAKPGAIAKQDDEYVRNGIAEIFPWNSAFRQKRPVLWQVAWKSIIPQSTEVGLTWPRLA